MSEVRTFSDNSESVSIASSSNAAKYMPLKILVHCYHVTQSLHGWV